MRVGLTVKLLVILGLTSAVSVLAMGLAARWSFQHGFLDYLGQQELTRITPLAEALLEVHEEHGSWDIFQRNPGAWPRFVDDALAPHPAGPYRDPKQGPNAARRGSPPEPIWRRQSPGDAFRPGPPGHPDAPPFAHPGGFRRGPHDEPPFLPPLGPPPDHDGARPFLPPRDGPPPGSGFAFPSGEERPAPPPRRPRHIAGRLRLLDAQRHQVAGWVREAEDELLTPLESEGVVVGWLGLSPPVWLEDELAQRFNSQHNRSLFWIAVAALSLAMLSGWVFGEGILRRVRAVARGARRLAKGDYGTRIVPRGRDELAELSKDFNHLAAALERNEELRRSGMADVSHELRTPVAVARAELDALIDGIRPCTKERLEQLQGRLLALVRLLDDLYDLALSDAGALNYRHAPLDLGEILEAAIGESRAAFADKDIELRLECDGELPITGDNGRLRQVLDNLLGNSLRYTDPGGFTQDPPTRAGWRSRSDCLLHENDVAR